MREAIALSLEENNEEGKEEDEEVELLKQAIALSLEAGHEKQHLVVKQKCFNV